MTSLTLLHTNDVHGYITPVPQPDGSQLGGYARRATLVQRLRARQPATLLLDAGDFYQGSRYWHAFQGQPDIRLMNLLGYDAATLGNHDFDGGLELLAARLKEAHFPVLSANFHVPASHFLAGLWQPWVFLQTGGLRVAVFGLTIESRELYPEAFFAQGGYITPYLETAASLLPRLRAQADVVILLSHLGQLGDEEVAANVPGIDLIIGGHNHHPLPEALFVNDIPIVRGPVGAPALSETRLEIRPRQPARLAFHRQHPLGGDIPSQPAIEAEIKGWVLPPAETIGQLGDALDTRTEIKCVGENRAGNFFTDTLLAHFAGQADFGLVHMGSLRGDRIYPAGDFTENDLLEFYPFDNEPVIVRLNAPQLKQVLEHGMSTLPVPTGIFLTFSGLRVRADTSRPGEILQGDRIVVPGERIVAAEANGQAIDFQDEHRVFRVLCDSYMASGGSGYLPMRTAEVLYRVPEGANHILRERFRRHSPVHVPLDGRLTFI
ncbi:MAG: bifunctional metallophosphatase/5'-nucleotidase [Anaerolineales bacterium]